MMVVTIPKTHTSPLEKMRRMQRVTAEVFKMTVLWSKLNRATKRRKPMIKPNRYPSFCKESQNMPKSYRWRPPLESETHWAAGKGQLRLANSTISALQSRVPISPCQPTICSGFNSYFA